MPKWKFLWTQKFLGFKSFGHKMFGNKFLVSKFSRAHKFFNLKSLLDPKYFGPQIISYCHTCFILVSQLSWESDKFQLARWSHNMTLFSWNHSPTRSPSISLTSRQTRDLKFSKQPYFTQIRWSKVFETFIQVTFVQLKFVLVLNLNFSGNQNFIYLLIFLMKIGPIDLFGLKHLVWQKKMLYLKHFWTQHILDQFFFIQNFCWVLVRACIYDFAKLRPSSSPAGLA